LIFSLFSLNVSITDEVKGVGQKNNGSRLKGIPGRRKSAAGLDSRSGANRDDEKDRVISPYQLTPNGLSVEVLSASLYQLLANR
jgi:hypothetical protein